MPRKSKSMGSPLVGCGYQVSAVIGVDARGQMVMPKDVRERMGIRAGDRMAVIVHESGGKACCMSLMRIGDLSRMVRAPLKAILQEGDL